MTTIGSLFVSIGVKTADLEKGLSKAGKAVSNFSKVGLAGVGAGLAMVGTGMAVVGKASFDLSRDIETSQNKLRAELGLSETAAEQFGKMATTVFANNFGEDLDEATEALIATRQQLGELSENELVGATENAFKLADAFDADMGQSLNAANVLMEEFGLTQGEAFDFIATGFQKGLNSSDDFLDSIGEYGNLFGDMGFEADQFFSIMESGLEGGVLGTDKISDAMKEFNLRITDMDTDTHRAIDTLLGVEGASIDMFNGLSSGILDTEDAFRILTAKLAQIEDPIERNRLQVELFGTMAEDLGVSFTNGLSTATTSLEDMAGATEDLNAQYDNLGAFTSEMWRKMLVSLAPATDKLLELANDVMPVVREFFEKAQPIFDKFAVTFGDTISKALPVVGDALFRIGEALGIGGDEASGMDMLLAGLTTTLDLIVTSIEATAVVFHILANAIEAVSTAYEKLNNRSIATSQAFSNAAIIREAAFSDPGALAHAIGLPGFATGGIVPGPMGAPQLAVVHGGETITPAGQSSGTNIYIDGINVGSSGEGGIDEALRMAFETLRMKLAAAG